jgi:uncharacterized protein YodC (DUF2158 family)
MTALKPGDLVVLKSGGPVMTVDTVNTDVFDDDKVTGVLCAWFIGNKLERARFDPGAIVPAPSPDENAESRPVENAGAYKAILDEMVAAMNDPAEPSDEASKASAERSKRASAKKSAADASTTEARGAH